MRWVTTYELLRLNIVSVFPAAAGLLRSLIYAGAGRVRLETWGCRWPLRFVGEPGPSIWLGSRREANGGRGPRTKLKNSGRE